MKLFRTFTQHIDLHPKHDWMDWHMLHLITADHLGSLPYKFPFPLTYTQEIGLYLGRDVF